MSLVGAGCGKTETVVRTLTAKDDFTPGTIAGFAPTALNNRRGKWVINVDADKTGYQFGAASAEWPGPGGTYTLRLNTLGDGDGQSSYKLHIDGKELRDTFTQPAAEEQVYSYRWSKVRLEAGAEILVLSNGSDSEQHTGGKGPNGFHMAHGRWVSLEVMVASNSPASNSSQSP